MSDDGDGQVFYCGYPGCDDRLVPRVVPTPNFSSRIGGGVLTWDCPRGHRQTLGGRRTRRRTPADRTILDQ